MRVVAGKYGGRVLDAPEGRSTRPTTDRVRESMFSSLYSRLGGFEDVDVLDAFAGSGALGIEALSRGARSCLFFDSDAHAREVLAGNLSSLDLAAPQVAVRSDDVFEAARRGLSPVRPFRLVCLDPPYAVPAADVAGLLAGLVESGCLAPGCVIAYEHAFADAPSVARVFEQDGPLAPTGQKKYGKIGVTYLEYAG